MTQVVQEPVIKTNQKRGNGRPPKDYDWATEYAKMLTEGKIPSSKKNMKVAHRHLNDLMYGVEGYTFKPELANNVIKFIEMLPDPKTGKPLTLRLFQKFIVSSLYGWVDENGYRRFTKAYISMARKQGRRFA